MKLKTLILAACFAIMAVVTMTPTTAEAAVCPKGQYSATGESPCQSCPKGTYADELGSTSCTLCPEGHYTTQTGRSAITACKPCSAGEYSVSNRKSCAQCPAGTYSAAGGACTSCPAGKYSAAGAASCTSCPAGKYSKGPHQRDAAGAATCTSCPRGQGSLPGSSSCVTCNDQPWTWQKCNNDQCPKAANKNAAGDCKCKKAHNWSRRKQKCVKK